MCNPSDYGPEFSNCLTNYSSVDDQEWFMYMKTFLTVVVPDIILLETGSYFSSFEYCPWIFSLLGSILVGLSGIFPLLVIPVDSGTDLKSGEGSRTLKILLSFAVGGLLGDVFLHLLPEAWQSDVNKGVDGHPSLCTGLWVLVGILCFIIIEKAFSPESLACIASTMKLAHLDTIENSERICKNISMVSASEVDPLNNNIKKTDYANGSATFVNGDVKHSAVQNSDVHNPKQVTGYLNLMANSIDNFTHGLAVGGSFLVSLRLGIITTFAILIHEIPHEVGDFAILLRSGFTRIDAAKAQLWTASSVVLGSMITVLFSEASGTIESKTSWILPFTAGGFLHISLVTILPELLQEENPKESLKQLSSMLLGIAVMATLTTFCDS